MVLLGTGSKVRVIYKPICHFTGVLRVVFRDEPFMNIAHADYSIRPLQQLGGYTLRPMVVRVISKFLECFSHFSRNLTVQRRHLTCTT